MLERLKLLIKDVMPEVNVERVTNEDRLFEDLHFDSLAIMMLSMAIEDEFKIEFDEAPMFATVGEVIEYIEKRVK